MASKPIVFSSPIAGRTAPKGKNPNIPGDQYGRLTLVSEIVNLDQSPSNRKWNVECSCSNHTSTTVTLYNLRGGITTSCGCAQREMAAARHTTHGMRHHILYSKWNHMISRCCNINDKSFVNYGGRGVTVCEKWHTFENFYADMSVGYSAGLSLDRINNDKGYSQENCRWATNTVQARNRRSNRLVVYRGKNITMIEAAEIAGVNYNIARQRINRDGWTISRALGPEFDAPIF